MHKWHHQLLTRDYQSRFMTAVQTAYTRFLKIRGTPEEIARGLALGLLVGMTPFMGAQTAVAVFLAALLKWNKIAAALGVWITNPVTAPLIYGLTYYVGAKVVGGHAAHGLPDHLDWGGLLAVFRSTPEIVWTLIVGGLIVGIPLAVAGYYFSLAAIHEYRRKIKVRLSLKTEKIRNSLKKKKKKKKRTRR